MTWSSCCPVHSLNLELLTSNSLSFLCSGFQREEQGSDETGYC